MNDYELLAEKKRQAEEAGDTASAEMFGKLMYEASGDRATTETSNNIMQDAGAVAMPSQPATLPDPVKEEQAAQFNEGLDQLADQLSEEDATPETPAEDVAELPDLDLSSDPADHVPPTPPAGKAEPPARDLAGARSAIKAAAAKRAASRKVRLGKGPTEPTPAEVADKVLGGFTEGLPETAPPPAAEHVKPQPFDGGPARDFGEQLFPQGDASQDIAAAEAALRSAFEQMNRSTLETIEALTRACLEQDAELARLRGMLERRRV